MRNLRHYIEWKRASLGADMMKRLLIAVLAVGVLSGCEGGGNNEAAGTIIGAGLGALAGGHIGHRGSSSRAAGITLGAIAGGVLGNQVGKKLDRADQIALEQARQKSLEQGRSYNTTGWYNPDTGSQGTVTPKPAYRTSDGRYCREFQQTITVDGEEVRGYGTACRQPDGSWEITS